MPDELENAALPLLEEMDKARVRRRDEWVCDWHNHVLKPVECLCRGQVLIHVAAMWLRIGHFVLY